jgi:hypothetical protein
VHHYAFDHYTSWQAEFPEAAHHFERPPSFGENLSTTGMTEATICVGDVYRVGTALEARPPLRRAGAPASSDYTPPEWACNTTRAVYHSLGELERDVHEHVHKENNILFPRISPALNG